MKKSIIIILISSIIFCSKGFGQDALLMNDLNYNSVGYNSSFIAAATSKLNASFTTSIGNGIQNTSKVNFLAYANIEKYKFGVGLKLNSKFFGLFKTNTAEVLYAKELKIDEDHKLFLGFNIGMHFSSLAMNKLTNQVNFDDPFLIANELPQYRLTAGLGVGYTFKNKIKAGFSIPVLVKNNNDFSPVYIFNTSYRHQATQVLSLTPEVLAYGSDIEPFTIEGNLKLDYKDYVWFKIGGRSTNSTMLGIGWQHSFVNIGYIHNMYFGEYSKINQAVHNVNVTFQFGNHAKQKVKQISELENQELLQEINLANQLQVQKEADKKEAEVLARKEESKELSRRQDQLEKEIVELAQKDELEKEVEEAEEQSRKDEFKKEVEEIVKQTLHYGTYKVTEETSLRIKASFSSKILKRLSVGKKVLLLEKTSRYWWMVDYDGKVGYVKALLLEKQ
jgi:type IX secretion system PorP/SprF family membrane protein